MFTDYSWHRYSRIAVDILENERIFHLGGVDSSFNEFEQIL